MPHPDRFVARHVGPDDAEISQMLGELGLSSLDALADAVVADIARPVSP